MPTTFHVCAVLTETSSATLKAALEDLDQLGRPPGGGAAQRRQRPQGGAAGGPCRVRRAREVHRLLRSLAERPRRAARRVVEDH
eukprot:2499131-Alexandrium_andersonii.AAC.1